VFAQAFVTELAVETFDVRVLVRLSRTDERWPNTALIRPLVEHLTVELGPVVDGYGLQQCATVGEAPGHAANS
jgi:hypothetical protein